MNIKIDETTGLPELPEGYFWRISQAIVSEDALRVELYRKRRFTSPVRIDFRMAGASSEEDMKRCIREEAGLLFKETFQPNKYAGFMGDYPPKSLNDRGN